MDKGPYVLVLYYSRHGATQNMAEEIATGVLQVTSVDAVLRTVPSVSTVCETTEPAIPQKGAVYCSEYDLRYCSGLIMGSPTRFGNMAASLKVFMESTSALWVSGALENKPAAVFTSSSSMHGGQESTLLSMMLPLIHHGMVMCGLPFSLPEIRHTESGGTPYGASHVAGEASDKPLTPSETTLCIALGRRVAEIAKKLAV